MKARTEISEENLQDLIYMVNGLLAPLTGFMTEEEYRAVVDDMRLPGRGTWTIPITLDVEEATGRAAMEARELLIDYRGKCVARVAAESFFEVTEADIAKIFGTDSGEHPGVRKEREKSPYRIGGKVALLDAGILEGHLNPEHTKEIFAAHGWKTVVGFQTRNALHRAHEYLQRTALELCDGLFINPVIGWKKAGDFTEQAVLAAYRCMMEDFFPSDRVYFEGLRTQMRYAGPREAIFHAIIRRNLGCTHFIVGRDHAGVGGFYGMYEAHALAREIMARGDLGIELLLLHGPYYCKKCGQVVTDKTCRHAEEDHISISGTKIRDCLMRGELPDERLMRPEISEAILSVGRDHIFIP